MELLHLKHILARKILYYAPESHKFMNCSNLNHSGENFIICNLNNFYFISGVNLGYFEDAWTALHPVYGTWGFDVVFGWIQSHSVLTAFPFHRADVTSRRKGNNKWSEPKQAAQLAVQQLPVVSSPHPATAFHRMGKCSGKNGASVCILLLTQSGAVATATYTEMSQQSNGHERGNLWGDLAARHSHPRCTGWQQVTLRGDTYLPGPTAVKDTAALFTGK